MNPAQPNVLQPTAGGTPSPGNPMAGKEPEMPILPMPVTTATNLMQAGDGTKMILLRCSTPQGVTHYCLGPDHAIVLAQQLANLAQQAKRILPVTADALKYIQPRANGGRGGR